MKKCLLLVLIGLLFSCSSDDRNNNCNFLINVGVNASIDLNLPQFSQLQFPSNAVRLEGQGNAGIIIVRVNNSSLRAWDGADPNHTISSCSRLEINGLSAVCGCTDANEYELISGQILGNNPQPCTLQEYRVEAVGNNRFLITN
jgi:hypothetical protein